MHFLPSVTNINLLDVFHIWVTAFCLLDNGICFKKSAVPLELSSWSVVCFSFCLSQCKFYLFVFSFICRSLSNWQQSFSLFHCHVSWVKKLLNRVCITGPFWRPKLHILLRTFSFLAFCKFPKIYLSSVMMLTFSLSKDQHSFCDAADLLQSVPICREILKPHPRSGDTNWLIFRNSNFNEKRGHHAWGAKRKILILYFICSLYLLILTDCPFLTESNQHGLMYYMLNFSIRVTVS